MTKRPLTVQTVSLPTLLVPANVPSGLIATVIAFRFETVFCRPHHQVKRAVFPVAATFRSMGFVSAVRPAS